MRFFVKNDERWFKRLLFVFSALLGLLDNFVTIFTFGVIASSFRFQFLTSDFYRPYKKYHK